MRENNSYRTPILYNTVVAVILNGAIDFPAQEHYEVFQLTYSTVASVQLMVYIIVRFAFTILKLRQRIEFRYHIGDRPETMRKLYNKYSTTNTIIS